jgi:hypothetical protein
LLIVTFFWALSERRRYRNADRFRTMALDFVTEALDHLYDESQDYLEKLRKTLDDISPIDLTVKSQMIQNFNINLYYTRTVVKHRVECFSDFSEIDSVFETMEDDLATAVDELDLGKKHPEVLAAYIAEGSSKIIRILLRHESALATRHGNIKQMWIRCRPKFWARTSK